MPHIKWVLPTPKPDHLTRFDSCESSVAAQRKNHQGAEGTEMSQTRLDEGHRRWGRSLGLAGRCIGLPEFSCGQHRHWRALRLLNDRVARSIGAATPPSNAGSIFAQPESAPPPRVQFGRSLNIATQPAATSRADGRLLSRPALSLKRAMGSSTESLTQRWLRQNIQPYAQKDTVYSHVDAVQLPRSNLSCATSEVWGSLNVLNCGL